MSGVPGLRALLHRRHVVLYLLHAKAEVTLAAVSYRQWDAALAFVEAAGDGRDHNPLRWLGNDPAPLAEQELAAILERPRATALLGLGSALLRRAGLWAGTRNLRVYEAQPDTLYLQWQAGPSTAEVATALVHPVTGLPGDRFFVVPQEQYVVVRSVEGGVFVVLQQLTEDDTPVAPPMQEVVARWKAWDERMWRPNPGWPQVAHEAKDGDTTENVPAS